MSAFRRTTWKHLLGKPVAGDVFDHHGMPAVPIAFGADEDLVLYDLDWSRDLATAVAVGISVLAAEHGLPTAERADCGGDAADCVHEAARGELEEERDVYRAILSRLTSAERPSELWPIIREASLALEHWAGRE